MDILRVLDMIAMKVHAIKNDATRLHKELADIQHLMRQPGVPTETVRRYFAAAGLTEYYSELKQND
ncbi:MAG: hypothetical protein MUF51_10735 [Vicinamibacteria bacterium]|jgi:hypothetical protein|nr:hypothetical protein [Vicinamibacteria bacterium]